MESYNFPDYLINEAGEAVANIIEPPYGSQSVLIYDDFNFDNVKDFALMNGYMSCYGGPSFDVYLAEKQGFVYSDGFSRLSNEYCGFFTTNPKTKTIFTMTKSGCCWHQYSEFTVEDNEPKILKIIEESYKMGTNFIESTERNFKNGKESVKTNLYFPTEDMAPQILLSFEIEKNGKKVILYDSSDNLGYVLIQKDEKIEFYFPDAYDEENYNTVFQKNDFVYEAETNSIRFQTQDATYQIYETEKSVGIKVQTKGKTYDLKGIKNSQSGSLKAILELEKLNNLNFK